MTWCDLDASVPDWVIEHPETLAVFRALEIDDSCGGKSLAYACQERGLDAQIVLFKLHQCLSNKDQPRPHQETKDGNSSCESGRDH